MNLRERRQKRVQGKAEEMTIYEGGVKRQPPFHSLSIYQWLGKLRNQVGACDFILSYSGSGLSLHRHWKREGKEALFSVFSYTRARYQYT